MDDNVKLDKILRDLAWQNIAGRPAEFLYRSMLKTLWWIGPSRVPQTDSSAYLHPDMNFIVLQGDSDVAKEVLYVLHRSIILVSALAAWKLRSFNKEKTQFLVLPTLSVLPVALAAFPDTRFRLAYDPYLHILASAGIINLYALIKDKIRSKKIS